MMPPTNSPSIGLTRYPVGAVLSTTTSTLAWLSWPAASRALTVIVCPPSASAVVSRASLMLTQPRPSTSYSTTSALLVANWDWTNKTRTFSRRAWSIIDVNCRAPGSLPSTSMAT